jgi:TonB-linked SusC/RagA family outer membrane protein
VSYNGFFGIKNISKTLDVMNPYEFALLQYEQAVLRGGVEDDYNPYFGVWEDIDLYRQMKGTDWQDVMFGRTGTTSNHSVTVSGGTSQASYTVGYNRVDDKAIMLGSSYWRDNINAKLSAKPLDWLKIDLSGRYSITNVDGAGANDVTGTEKSTNDSRVKNSVIYTPIPIKNMTTPDDDPESLGSLYPPTVQNADNDRHKKRNALNINAGISANLTPKLVLRTEVGLDHIFAEDNRFYGPSTYYVTGGGASNNSGKPAAQLTIDRGTSLRNTNTLSYSNTFCARHTVSLMVGQETIDTRSQTNVDIYHNLPDYFDSKTAWAFASRGEAMSIANTYAPPNRLVSFFGRLNYDFRDKYLLSATLRADGSSKFAKGNQWGYFPSVAAAWRVSDESFLRDTRWLSQLKLRASYGMAGNNNIPGGAYMQTYGSSSTTYLPFASSYWSAGKLMPNPDLRWETTTTRVAGVDFGVWNNRVSGSVDLYMNNTTDLLINFPVPGSGFETQMRNIGETSNKGIEVSLSAIAVDTKDFRLDFDFNISFNRNRVESLGGLAGLDGITSGWTKAAYGANDFMVQVGQPVGQIYGYVTDGIYSVNDFTWNGSEWTANPGVVDNSGLATVSWGPGALKLKDLDGSGDISVGNEDRRVIGNTMPKHTGGFGLTAAFRGFDLSAGFNWVYGNQILNANKIEFTNTGGYYNRNMLDMFSSGDRFTHIDMATGLRVTDPTELARINAGATLWSPIESGTTSYPVHSWAVEDGSFLRLNNLTIGYTFPVQLTRKLYVQQLRLYVTAYNLYTWTNYTGFDPEVDSRRSTPLTPGVDYSAYPRSRSINFGVNLTF